MSKAFGKHENSKESLDGIKLYIEAYDEELKWAMRSKDFIVRFEVGDIYGKEDAHGTTELMLGNEDLSAAILRDPHKVAKLLMNPTRITVKITIDRQALADQTLTFVTLAHEIGVHLKPRLKFIRKVVESGGITQQDLASILSVIGGEHAGAFHDSAHKPKNPTYFQIVDRMLAIIPDKQTKKYLVRLYSEDIKRYSPEEEGQKNQVVRYYAQHRQKEETVRRIAIGATSFLVMLGAILLMIYLFPRTTSK